MTTVSLQDFIASANTSPLAPWLNNPPWELIRHSESIVREMLNTLSPDEFVINAEVAVHKTATIENGAILKGPLIVGANGFVAAGAYLRGGNWIDRHCIFGPGAELKSSFVFAGTKLAHFNFVGDAVLGAGVNLEAGSIICNYRNERADKEILVRLNGELHRTGVEKFGALVGDHARVGANGVVAPGAILLPGTVIGRAQLYDAEKG